MASAFEKAGELKARLNQQEKGLFSSLACFSADAVRRSEEPREKDDYRQAFSADADRILNSLAFTRYIDKTQVFSLINNDHLTHRVIHVQLVSRVARTIGRYLGLNQDLIEAASLGHDIGHPPFGHDGEGFLSELCREHGAGAFMHNLQSIQFLDRIERNGRGWNLSLQTMDAIVCHNGEVHATRIAPERNRTFKDFDRMCGRMQSEPGFTPVPMTLEGCVVRMADTISYIGRDLEDAIRLGLIKREQIPSLCREHLGKTNGTIVFSLVTDLIQNSLDQPWVGFSETVSSALKTLKDFNYRTIYKNPAIKRHLGSMAAMFEFVFHTCLNDLETGNRDSPIFSDFLDGMRPDYCETHGHAQIVRDYISGMTDSYFIRQVPESLRPRPVEHV